MIYIPVIFLIVYFTILVSFRIKKFIDFKRREPEIEPLIIHTIEWTKFHLNNDIFSNLLDSIIATNFEKVRIIKLKKSFAEMQTDYQKTLFLFKPIKKVFKKKFAGYLDMPKANPLISFTISAPFPIIVFIILKYNFNYTLSILSELIIIISFMLLYHIISIATYSHKITIYYDDCNNRNNAFRDIYFISAMIHELIHYIHFYRPKNKIINRIFPDYLIEGLPTYFQTHFLIQQNIPIESIENDIRKNPEKYFMGYQFVRFYIEKNNLCNNGIDTIMFKLLNLTLFEVFILRFQFLFKNTTRFNVRNHLKSTLHN